MVGGTNPGSSVLIAAERKGKNIHNTLTEIALHAARENIAVSVITLLELAHGIAPSETPDRKAMCQRFLKELTDTLPLHPVTVPIALGSTERRPLGGLRLPLSDLLIGVTALELGYRVATGNERHFQMFRGLEIVTF